MGSGFCKFIDIGTCVRFGRFIGDRSDNFGVMNMCYVWNCCYYWNGGLVVVGDYVDV